MRMEFFLVVNSSSFSPLWLLLLCIYVCMVACKRVYIQIYVTIIVRSMCVHIGGGEACFEWVMLPHTVDDMTTTMMQTHWLSRRLVALSLIDLYNDDNRTELITKSLSKVSSSSSSFFLKSENYCTSLWFWFSFR